MVLFTLVYNNEREDVIKNIGKMKKYFKSKDILIGLSENIQKQTHFIKIYCEEELSNNEFINLFNKYIYDILYDIIVDEFINRKLNKFILDTYFFLNKEEIKEIKQKIVGVLKNNDEEYIKSSIYCLNKKNQILKKIEKCIAQSDEVNIDGFITFRAKDLFIDVSGIVDKIVEKYMVDKEYKEFIKLLKYFVDTEESKIEELNILIDSNGKYNLKDSEGNDLTDNVYIDISDVKYVEDISIDDMLISWLITNVPKEINIYNINDCTNKELINTIKSVFEERVNIYKDKKPHKLKITNNKF